MPPKKVYYLFLAFLYCFMLLALAWFKDAQLVWGYRRGLSHIHPGLLLGVIAVAFVLTAKASKAGMTICTILLVLLSLGALKSHLLNHPPPPLQFHVIVSLVVICVYGWIQLLDQRF